MVATIKVSEYYISFREYMKKLEEYTSEIETTLQSLVGYMHKVNASKNKYESENKHNLFWVSELVKGMDSLNQRMHRISLNKIIMG